MDERTVGVLGGGQLGRMMAEAGQRLGLKLAILDPGGSSSPAGQICNLAIEGKFSEPSKIRELASISDVLTTEIEHVEVDTLMSLESEGHVVHPSPQSIKIIQDKYLQKCHLDSLGVALPDYMEITCLEDCYNAASIFGYPFMLKKRKLAYDGHGNYAIKNEEMINDGFNALGGCELYAEKWVPFSKEIAIMVVKTANGILTYPVVETIQKDNICHIVIAPAIIANNIVNDIKIMAELAVSSFEGYGIYGIELFLLPDDSVLLNEIAPRPHNSGHYTIEACNIDQFEMHLRAIMKLPCPQPAMKVNCAMMINILGQETMEETKAIFRKAMSLPGAGIHWYCKLESRTGRKMGHITLISSNFSALRSDALSLGVDDVLAQFADKAPRVGIIMGSDSDLPTMKDAAEILEQFGVSYELKIVSAHRTPNRMYTYAQTAAERGIEVIIAGAGGAAHLPGMVAALTTLPVIGVPVKTSTLAGTDSLLSIVQMPKGIPVATVAIGNAANAGLLAVRILASTGDGELRNKMESFLMKQEDEVLVKADQLELHGYKAYLEGSVK